MTSLPSEPSEFESVAEALKALAKLEAEIQTAETLSKLNAIARKAAAIQRFAPIKGRSRRQGMGRGRPQARPRARSRRQGEGDAVGRPKAWYRRSHCRTAD